MLSIHNFSTTVKAFSINTMHWYALIRRRACRHVIFPPSTSDSIIAQCASTRSCRCLVAWWCVLSVVSRPVLSGRARFGGPVTAAAAEIFLVVAAVIVLVQHGLWYPLPPGAGAQVSSYRMIRLHPMDMEVLSRGRTDTPYPRVLAYISMRTRRLQARPCGSSLRL